MRTEEKIVSCEDIFDGKVFKVKKYTVELPDGSKAFREEVLHGGGASAIAVDNGEILLVSQFRLSVNCDILEIPAGKLYEGEDPEDCARRELLEEVGIKAKKLTLISSAYSSPGFTNERTFVYFCEDFEKADQHLDEGEFLNVVKIPVEKAFSMLDNGEIIDGKTVIALLYLKNYLKEAKRSSVEAT